MHTEAFDQPMLFYPQKAAAELLPFGVPVGKICDKIVEDSILFSIHATMLLFFRTDK